MAVKDETRKVIVTMDGTEVGNTLKDIEGKMRSLRAEFRATSDEAERSKISNTYKELGGYASTLKEQLTGVKQALTEVNEEVVKSQSTWQGVKEVMTGVFGGELIERGLHSIMEWGKESIKAFAEAEAGEQRLLFAEKNRLGVQEQLIKYAEELQDKTGVNKDKIIDQEAFLAVQGRSEEQIKKVIKAAIELSAVTGDDLSTSVQKLDATFEGNIGRLGKLDKAFKDLSPTQLENGAAIDLVNEKYNGFAESVMDKTEGQIKQAQNRWENFGKSIGGVIADAWASFTNYGNLLDGWLVSMKETTEKASEPLDIFTQQIEDQQKKLAGVAPFSKEYFDIMKNISDLTFEKFAADNPVAKQIVSLSSLNKELTHAKEVYDAAAVGSKEFYAAQAKVKEIEEEIAALTGKQTAEQKKLTEEYNKQQAALKKLYEEEKAQQDFLLKLSASVESDPYVKLQKERLTAITEAQYKFKGNDADLHEALLLIEEQYLQKKAALDAKATEADKKSIEKAHKEDLDEALKFWKSKENIELANLANEGLNKSEAEAKKNAIELKYMELEKDELIAHGQDITAITQKIEDKKIAIAEIAAEKRKKIEEGVINSLKSIFDSYDKFVTNAENAQLALDQKNTDAAIKLDTEETKKKKDNLKEELREKGISQVRYDKAMQALDDESAGHQKDLQDKQSKEEARIKNEQAQRAHILAIFNGAINGASAIIKAFDEGGYALAIAVGAAVAVEEASIIAEPVPTFAHGGHMKVNGTDGKVHNSTYEGILKGGYYSSPTLALVGEVPGEHEYVISGAMMRNPAIANIAGMLEGVRVNKQFADGGFTNNPASLVPVSTNSTSSDLREQQMIAALNNNSTIMNALLARQNNPVPTRSYIVYQDQQSANNKVGNIQNSARLGN